MKSLRAACLVVALTVSSSALFSAEAPSDELGRPPAADFRTVASTHFRVHHEASYAPAGVLNVLEGLHAKLLLDLLPFAPWAKDGVVDVYIYRDGDSYHGRTGAPAWAGGHINAAERRVHVFESDQFSRTMAHELGHLFFDDYFVSKGAPPPVWLNEGVASLMEWDYGLREENRPRKDQVRPLGEFLAFNYHRHGGAGSEVSAWYRQAASLAEFLMRRFSRAQFTQFCDELRRGATLQEALPRAYGPQLPGVEELDRLWRAGLE